MYYACYTVIITIKTKYNTTMTDDELVKKHLRWGTEHTLKYCGKE
jgi:hypothetical protein